jgi:hypothetical protein
MSREKKKVKRDNGDVLKKIVDAANSFKNAPQSGVDHPYFNYRDRKMFAGVTCWDKSSGGR